jgi:hypothetical protein
MALANVPVRSGGEFPLVPVQPTHSFSGPVDRRHRFRTKTTDDRGGLLVILKRVLIGKPLLWITD